MNMEPETDREVFISLNGEVKALRETIERFGASLMTLENTKFANHEIRITTLEKSEHERSGMWKLILGIGVLLSIASATILVKLFS